MSSTTIFLKKVHVKLTSYNLLMMASSCDEVCVIGNTFSNLATEPPTTVAFQSGQVREVHFRTRCSNPVGLVQCENTDLGSQPTNQGGETSGIFIEFCLHRDSEIKTCMWSQQPAQLLQYDHNFDGAHASLKAKA